MMITIVTVVSRMMVVVVVEVRCTRGADSMPTVATRSNILQPLKPIVGQGMVMKLKIKIFSVVSNVHKRFRWAIRTVWAIPAQVLGSRGAATFPDG